MSTDTGKITDMAFRFANRSERLLDLSEYDFTNVESILWMFQNCPNLEEVILPESILQVRDVMRETEEMGKVASPYTRWVYGSTPIPEHELETRMVKVRKKITFGEATDSERRAQLGLGPRTKITIVPKKKSVGRR